MLRPVHTVEDLAELADMPRSTAYRFVTLLRDYELLELAGGGRYKLGPRAITMGYVARSLTDVADVWRPVLDELVGQTHETALILRRVSNYAVCVDRVESDHPVRLSFEIGRTMPLHQGAGAKVLLANSLQSFQDRYLKEEVPARERSVLRPELDSILDQGYADSTSEVDPGIWATAASISQSGAEPLFALSVAIPEYRLEEDQRDAVRRQVLSAAATLRTRLSQYT